MTCESNTKSSNVSGLRIAEELTPKVLPVTPTWVAYEPNSYSDFGGQITTVARNPINESRQRQKGVTVDLDAVGGFNQDFVQDKLRDILQGFMFADWRTQPSQAVTATDTISDNYTVASETGFQVGNLILAKDFTDAANNGLKTVDAVSAGTVSVSQNLVTSGSPGAAAKITVVGFEGAAGDIDVDVPGGGAKNAYTSTLLNFTSLGLVPGAWVFVGGDAAGTFYPTNAGNNGFKRVYSIAANRLEVDLGGESMVTQASAAETIRLFLPETLKNEADPALITCRTYQLERTLGNDGVGIQSEYEVGSVGSQFQFNVAGQDKITVDMSFIAQDEEVRTGTVGLKSGNRPALEKEEAFNTSSNFSRLKLTRISTGLPLFAYVTEFTLTINNSLSVNKAVSVLGAIDVSPGQFVVSAAITAYFVDVTAKEAVRNNESVAFDFAIVKNNAGWVVSVPEVTLGDARLNVEQDAPITLPLSLDAGADPVFDHTTLLNNFPYLPNLAG